MFRRETLCLTLLLALVAGCSRNPSDQSTSAGDAAVSEKHSSARMRMKRPGASGQAPSTADLTPPSGYSFKKDLETWDTVYTMGHKSGYQHTKVERVRAKESDQEEVHIQSDLRLGYLRMGQPTSVQSTLTSRETPDGRLIDFEAVDTFGSAPKRVRGRVEGNELILETTVEGQTRITRLPWSKSNGGFQGANFSLTAKPMKPGETRALRALMQTNYKVITIFLTARNFEEVDVLGSRRRLLRIDNTIWLGPNLTLDGTLWVNERGETIKTHVPAPLDQETFRCSREVATDRKGMGQFDITLGSLVPLEHRIPNPHARRRIQFRARLKQGDPLAVLPAGMSQKIELTDAHTVDVTVLAVRPEWPEMLITPVKDLPTEDDRTANSLIQSDNELVMAMAKTATAGKKDDWSKAVALERYVYDNIENKNFLQTLASAAEVARTREGDCTEHAVLLAAMARAVGLPARVAVGLVYIERSQEPKHAFAYHMWTEIHVNHRWIPMDATLGLGGAGPARLKLAHGSLKDSDAMSSFLPVIKVLGQLQLEVIDFE